MPDEFDYVDYAESYERKNGRVTIPLGKRMVELTTSSEFGAPFTSESIVHDNAAGPGTITSAVLAYLQSAELNLELSPQIHCTDSSPPMLRVIERKYPASSSFARVSTAEMDCKSLAFPSHSFTHSFTSLAIFLFDDTDAVSVAREIYRTLREEPAGVACLSTMKAVGWLPVFQRTQARVKPSEDGTPWPGLLSPQWSTKEHLERVLQEGGFEREKMHTESLTTPFSMRDFLEESKPMITTATNRLTEGWSDEEKAEFGKVLVEEVNAQVKMGDVANEFWIIVAKK